MIDISIIENESIVNLMIQAIMAVHLVNQKC